MALLDLSDHAGAHPRLGVLDVVPFVALRHGRVHQAAGRRRVAGAVGRPRPLRASGPPVTSASPASSTGPGPAGACAPCPRSGGGPSPPSPRTGGHRGPTPGRRRRGRRTRRAGGLQPLVGRRRRRRRHDRWPRRSGGPGCGRSASIWPARPRCRATWWTRWRLGPAAVYDQVGALVRSSGGRIARAELVGLLPERRCWPPCPSGGGLRSTCRPTAPSRPGWSASGSGADDLALHRPGPAEPPALPLAHAAPDPELLPVGQGVLEAVLTDDAATADFLGLRVEAPRSGKKRSGSTPMQLACACQLRSWRP